jgi:tetratricopeptide (TPR) repeat protein
VFKTTMFKLTLQVFLTGIPRAVVLMATVIAGSALAQNQTTDQPINNETINVSDAGETRSLLARAESLISAQESERAYDLLNPFELDLAGSPYFDYLLGVAALDSGRVSEAIFSLRRSLAVAPAFSGARMELGRAYFESGNGALARPLFVSLLDENPPAGVREVLQEYINAIDRPGTAQRSQLRGYVETFVGHDSNANGSTSNQQFLDFTLSPENLATESPFLEVAGGFSWLVPQGNRFNWFVNGRAGHRSNTDASFINATILSGFGGMNWQHNAWFGRAGVDTYWSSRDGDANETYAGIDLLFGRRVTDTWDLTFGLRGGAQRYDASIEVLDVNRYLYTLGTAYRFESLARLGFELIAGSDTEQQSGSPYGNSKSGGRITFSTPMGNASYLHTSIGSLTTDYDGLFFGVPREDKQLTAMVRLEFRDVWADGLSLMPMARYVDNDSDVALYEYDRTEIGLIIRWAPK